MAVHYVTEPDQIPEGQYRLFDISNRPIAIYNLEGEFYAILNLCPHQGAEMCKGLVGGTTLPSRVYEYTYGRVGEILRCPWHGWEFDIRTGKSLVRDNTRLRSFKVVVDDGKLGVVM
jgi:nitrite reductase (NADH) small subunit